MTLPDLGQNQQIWEVIMKHEDKVMRDIIAGREPEKKIQVGYTPRAADKNQEEVERKERLSKILQQARRPLFCPECGKVMKGRADDKMWTYRSKCSKCAIDEDTMMMIRGEFDEFAEERIRRNKIAFLKEMKQLLEDNLNHLKNPEFVFETGELEKWSGPNLEKVKEDIMKDVEEVNRLLEEMENEGETAT